MLFVRDLAAACASLFDFGRQELDSNAQRRFRIKPHLLSLQPVTSLMLTKVGGAEEEDGASPRKWGGKPADLLSPSPSFFFLFLPHTEAPSVHRLGAFAFVFHSVTAYVRNSL